MPQLLTHQRHMQEPQGGAWTLVYSPEIAEDQGHLPELGVSEQIQGIPRGACLLCNQLGGKMHSEGPGKEFCTGQIQGQG